jgi:hypothetical protein
MSNLVFEILLRLVKPAAALLLALVVWIALVGGLGVSPSAELALLCWLSGAAFVLSSIGAAQPAMGWSIRLNNM